MNECFFTPDFSAVNGSRGMRVFNCVEIALRYNYCNAKNARPHQNQRDWRESCCYFGTQYMYICATFVYTVSFSTKHTIILNDSGRCNHIYVTDLVTGLFFGSEQSSKLAKYIARIHRVSCQACTFANKPSTKLLVNANTRQMKPPLGVGLVKRSD